MVVTEEEAYELLAYLTASAELCTREPYYYGTFRLIEAASRLMGFMLKHGDEGQLWLRDFKRDVDEKKVWMMSDRPGYFEFLDQVTAKLALHLKEGIVERATSVD